MPISRIYAPRTSQPQALVGPAPAFADALVLTLPGLNGPVNVARNRPGFDNSTAAAVKYTGEAVTNTYNGTTSSSVTRGTVPIGSAFTVFCWTRPSAINTGYARLVESDFATGFFLGSAFANSYCFIVNNSSLEGCIGGSQSIGRRDFVVGTFANGVRSLYVNGALVASAAATAPSSTSTLCVGRQNSAAAGYWAGDIGTVGYLPRALSPAVIAALYQNAWQLFAPLERSIWAPASAGGGAADLATNGATHGHTADSLALTTGSVLSIADAMHGHAADGITLTTASVLALQDALHAHTADGVTLLTGASLLIADALHAHTADGLALTVDAYLAISNATHGHTATSLVLTVDGVVVATISAPPLGHGPELAARVRQALASRPRNLSTRIR